MSGEGPHDEVLTQTTAEEAPLPTASTAVATTVEPEPVATGEPVGAGKPAEPAE